MNSYTREKWFNLCETEYISPFRSVLLRKAYKQKKDYTYKLMNRVKKGEQKKQNNLQSDQYLVKTSPYTVWKPIVLHSGEGVVKGENSVSAIEGTYSHEIFTSRRLIFGIQFFFVKLNANAWKLLVLGKTNLFDYVSTSTGFVVEINIEADVGVDLDNKSNVRLTSF